MIRVKSVLIVLAATLLLTGNAFSQDASRFAFEYGFLGVLSHNIQLSRDGTEFDYRNEGAQNVLFPFWRIAAQLNKNPHTFHLLYQPLALETFETLERDILVDELEFTEGTPVRFFYGFPFYRAGYTYQFTSFDNRWQFSLGGALQIRNATISFTSLDGQLLRSSRDVGLVPLIKIISSYQLFQALTLETEIDGIYAPIKYLNLSNTDVEGAFIDANLRAVFMGRGFLGSYANLRYLGGGAEGQSDSDGPGDGFVKNWLHFLTLTLGFAISL